MGPRRQRPGTAAAAVGLGVGGRRSAAVAEQGSPAQGAGTLDHLVFARIFSRWIS